MYGHISIYAYPMETATSSDFSTSRVSMCNQVRPLMISTVFTFHISTPRMQKQEDGRFRDSQEACTACFTRWDSFNLKFNATET